MRKIKLNGWRKESEWIDVPDSVICIFVYGVTGDEKCEFYIDETEFGGSLEYLYECDPFYEGRRKDCLDYIYFLNTDNDLDAWNEGRHEEIETKVFFGDRDYVCHH